MLGFLLGAALVLATLFVVRVLVRRRLARRCRGRGAGGPGHGRRARWGAAWVKRRLDLDEDQADIADHAVRDVTDAVSTFRRALKDRRADLGDVLAEETLDDDRLRELFAQLDDDLDRARQDVVAAVRQLHGVLDARQRELVAQWLRR